MPSGSRPITAAGWQPTEAGVDAVMAAVNTSVDDEGVAFVTEPAAAARRAWDWRKASAGWTLATDRPPTAARTSGTGVRR